MNQDSESGNSVSNAANNTQVLLNRISELESLLQQQNQEILELRSQLHNLQTINETDSKDDCNRVLESQTRHRANGISAEPLTSASLQAVTNETCTVYEKSETSLELLKGAIMENDYLKNLDNKQIKRIIDSMYPVEYINGSVIIKEGDLGSIVYILEEGRVEVFRKGKYICTIAPGRVFGELALLYDCKHTATVIAVTNCLLWAIERHCFQIIMMRSELLRQAKYIGLLKSLQIFKDFPEHTIIKIADALEETHYNNGDYIIRQGTHSDTFFIVYKGQVKVTQKSPSSNDETFIRTLTKGDFFGEKALQDDDLRTANFISDAPDGTTCLVIDRKIYTSLISSDNEIGSKYKDENDNKNNTGDEFANLTLSDLNLITILGVGGFARVALVQIKGDPNRSFALKRIKKVDIVNMGQKEHVISEKNIMLEMNCDFIVKLYKTFKDPKYLYLLMECCLGGELWALLRDCGQFDDAATRFYAACIVEAFKYMHSRNIVYRDLKSENLVLDVKGYVKLIDFGFAKKLKSGNKTWTFCGTLEYVAPEVIMNRGHDASRDLWSLGVLMFELLTGFPPFRGDDPVKLYKKILKGIDAVDFPYYITKNAVDLIKKLCRAKPHRRLGCQQGGIVDIQKHRWYDGFNWEGLVEHTLLPPFSPVVESVFDTKNFDRYPPDLSDPPPDDLSGWDEDF